METTSVLKKKRASTPRVRSGCRTCRKRHVKCDETQPSCLKCTQAGWECDGFTQYNAHAKISASKKNAAAAVTTIRSALGINSYAIPFRVPGSQRDRHILHYFCVKGCYEISGWFNTEFWTRDVLQQSHEDHVARQALVALSSLHLDYTTTSLLEKSTTKFEALHQYGKALRALGRRLKTPGPESRKLALTCCILFYCVEAALGNSEAAMCHLDNGLNLFSSAVQLQGGDDLNALRCVFETLDLQATLFDDERKPYLILMPDLEQDSGATANVCADAFSDPDEAHRAITRLQNGLFRFLTTSMPYKSFAEDLLPASIIHQKRCLKERFQSWLSRFGYLKIMKNQSKEIACAVETLLIQWQVSTMLLEADYPADQSIFASTPNPRAEEVLSLAESVLNHTRDEKLSTETNSKLRRNLSSENGIVAPIFVLAAKCSDEHISARATRLLAVSQRREGLYDAQSMVTVIQQFVRTRHQRRLQSSAPRIEESENLSLEKEFEIELNGSSVRGMDRVAECLKPTSITLH